MRAYKFDTHISNDGTITIPFTPDLMGKEVELIIVPKDSEVQKISKEELMQRIEESEKDIGNGKVLSHEELEKESLLW